jgi:hypothetical protein
LEVSYKEVICGEWVNYCIDRALYFNLERVKDPIFYLQIMKPVRW